MRSEQWFTAAIAKPHRKQATDTNAFKGNGIKFEEKLRSSRWSKNNSVKKNCVCGIFSCGRPHTKHLIDAFNYKWLFCILKPRENKTHRTKHTHTENKTKKQTHSMLQRLNRTCDVRTRNKIAFRLCVGTCMHVYIWCLLDKTFFHAFSI